MDWGKGEGNGGKGETSTNLALKSIGQIGSKKIGGIEEGVTEKVTLLHFPSRGSFPSIYASHFLPPVQLLAFLAPL